MKQEVFRDRQDKSVLFELTLARLEHAEKLLERASFILPRIGGDDLREIDQLTRDVAQFLEEGE